MNQLQGVRAVGRPIYTHPSNLTEAQERELMSGVQIAAMFVAGEVPESYFDSEAHRRAAWAMHSDRLCAEQAAKHPGDRPLAFWEYEGVPELSPCGPQLDVKRVTFLIEGGHLFDLEGDELIRVGKEAQERIDTDAERFGPNFFPDRAAAETGELVEGSRGIA